jgi:hypothetical protein
MFFDPQSSDAAPAVKNGLGLGLPKHLSIDDVAGLDDQ